MLRGLLAILALLPARAGVREDELSRLSDSLRGGEWVERVRAVARLSELGEDGTDGLRSALKDPDWQVRLGAVEGLGADADADSLERAVGSEACPVVAMSAAHWLGRLRPRARVRLKAARGDYARCEGWLWPPETSSRGSFAVSKADTPADENGCRYVRFLKQGGIRCPAGTIAKGLGQAPAPPDLLAGSADSGVALCCPPDVTAPEGAAPQEVECRVHPMECPAGWSEMEAPADRERALESGRYSRTRRMREGDIQWVHCCRPHELARGPQAPEDVWSAPPAAPEQPPAEPARGSGPVSAPMPEGRSATEAAPAAPDREVAIDLRLAELDRLLGSPESFPPQKSLQRPEAAVDADAGVQAPARRGAEPSLAAVPGASESLSGPAGPGARTDPRVRGDSAFMPDAGMRKTNRPLPELLKLLESRDPRARARAADEIGSLGAEGRPAVARLKTALKDSSARVRAAAALALGSASRGGDDAVRELARALKDRSADVRYCAAEALGRIGTPAADRAFGGHILRSAKTLAQGG